MKPGWPAPAAPKRCIEAIRSCSLPGLGVWIDMWMIIWLLPSGASLGLAGLPLPTSLLDQLVQLPQRVRLEPVGALALAQFPGLPRRAFQQRRAAGGRPGVVLVLRDELRHDVIAHVPPGVPARQVRAARADCGDLVDSAVSYTHLRAH